MPPRKDLCRNFQRGSCQYGDRCKFLHATTQQPKTNPFGFGTPSGSQFQQTNQQQQQTNPFGFGVKNNNTQSRGGNGFGSKPNQPKPFENTWARFDPLNTSNAPASQQPENQQQAANHKCTDPESCKRIILEDFENENPLWKLTCYAHNKNGPCDIVGDISCEELRALAYDEVKQGKSFQFINIGGGDGSRIYVWAQKAKKKYIDRERSLQNSKLVEFQNLAHKPYTVSSVATPSTQNPIAFSTANTPTMNTSVSSLASSFGQLNASLNTGPAALPNYTFGQSSTAQNNISQPSNFFPTNTSPFNTSGAFGVKPSHPYVQSSLPFGSASLINGSDSAQKNPFSTLANSSAQQAQQMGNPFDKYFLQWTQLSFKDITLREYCNVDDSVWKKAEWKWNIGEIPEDAPPDIYIH